MTDCLYVTPVTALRCWLALTMSATFLSAARAADVPLWGRFETTVDNSRAYANPFRDVELNATFTSPTGRAINFFGFFDGDGKGGQDGHVWKLRFMPDEVGKWSYQCSFSDGAGEKRGTFTCVSQGAKPGPLRIDGAAFKFAGGARFYPRSYYFSEAFSGSSPHWKAGIETFFGDRGRYNWCCTTFWQGKLLKQHRWNNLPFNGFYPIRNGDYTRLDVAAWKHVDEVLRELESRGVVWFNFDGFVPNVGGEMRAQRGDPNAQKVYIRNAIARLAPYWNVTWNVAFEWREFMSSEDVRRIADLTRALDPWDHPVTVHDQGGLKSAQEIISQLHVDFVTLQYDAGKCGDALTANHFVRQFRGNVPVYAQEVCWEAGTKLDADGVRKGGWGVVLAGGILNYAEMFDGPHERSPENYGDGRALPSLKILFDFMQALPYEKMEPHNELVDSQQLCFAEPGEHYACYAPMGGHVELDLSKQKGTFTAQWLDPRTGVVIPCGTARGGMQFRTDCPGKDDWLLYLHKKTDHR